MGFDCKQIGSNIREFGAESTVKRFLVVVGRVNGFLLAKMGCKDPRLDARLMSRK